MSAFQPKATEQRTQFYVGSVPIGDIASDQARMVESRRAGNEPSRLLWPEPVRSSPIGIEGPVPRLLFQQITNFCQ
jgi:hypothetical protein